MEKIETKYIAIPNIIINDMDISNDAKLLYGFIKYWDYFQKFYITYEEMKEQLNVGSINSIKKYLKQLKDKGYLDIIKINNNKQILKPLVSDDLILTTKEEAIKYNRIIKEPNYQEIVERKNLIGELYEKIK